MTASSPLKAPLPYFGGKSRAADLIWSRFGTVRNFVEPFCGSMAVLLARPGPFSTETVNDFDGLLSNMWRAIRLDPDAVAFYADDIVSECDLHAKHITLVNARQELTARLMGDPDWYDARLAGYYLWGACNWIGSGWCDGSGPWIERDGLLVNRKECGQLSGVSRKLPHLGDAGVGVSRQLPHLGDAGVGVSRQLPHLGDAGKGVSRQLPHLGNAGVGVAPDALARIGVRRKLPNVSSHGSGTNSEYAQENPGLYQWMRDLSIRLRRVRICCGDWTRVLGESVTTKHGLTAVFLDPPYNADNADNAVYGVAHDASLSAAAREWAIANGDNPLLRICLAGYSDEHEFPDTWEAVPWKARKGYQKVDKDGGHNGERETLWFSPHCIRPAPPAPPPDPALGTLWEQP